jgi:predicted PurR-regulated permease PerM
MQGEEPSETPEASSEEDGQGLSSVSARQRARFERWNRYTRYLFLLARFLFYGAIIGGGLYVLSQIQSVLFPVFISLLIAYICDPFVDWFEERSVPRTAGIATVILIGLTLVAGFVLFLYPTVVEQASKVGSQFPALVDTLQTQTIPWVEKTFDYEIPSSIAEGVDKYGQQLENALPSVMNSVGAWATSVVTQTSMFVVSLLNLIMIPIFSFYFLRDFDRMTNAMIDYVPEYCRDPVLVRLRKMDRVVGDWLRGQLQVASILAVLFAIGFSVAFSLAGIKVRAGIAIGVLTGLLNFIPYLGAFVGSILAVTMVLINWSGWAPLLAVAVVIVSVQTIEGYFITPTVVGEKVGLRPVTVIIVLLIGGELFGLLGVLLAIPVFGALKVLFPDFKRWYQQSSLYTGRAKVPPWGEPLVRDATEGDGGPLDDDLPTMEEESDATAEGRAEDDTSDRTTDQAADAGSRSDRNDDTSPRAEQTGGDKASDDAEESSEPTGDEKADDRDGAEEA